jgi:hypothetical protein
MACIHKFARDLNLEHLNFKPFTLVVGTFNPGWEQLANSAGWFYGRTHNNYFWDVLPRIYGHASLRKAPISEWKAFCRHNRIALTDLIASIDDANEDNLDHLAYIASFRDDCITKHFKHLTLVNMPQLLAQHDSIRQVYLTRSINDRFWRRLWQPVSSYCQLHGIHCQSLLTPSGSARFSVPKDAGISLSDYIFKQWQEKWLPAGTNVIETLSQQ